MLIALAADILILARCEGAPETARYFSDRLKLSVTEKMIKGIKAKAAKGDIIVTREELEEAAMSHPIPAARMKREPSLCDPQQYRPAFPPPTIPGAKPTIPAAKPVRKIPAKNGKLTKAVKTENSKNPDRVTPPANSPLSGKENSGKIEIVRSPGNQQLVSEFCDSKFAPKSRGLLIPYAAQVVYIARMSRSTRLTAAFFSKKFGRKFSRRPVEDILAKVKTGEIVVTTEQLAAAAEQHPYAREFAATFPKILNP